MLKIKEISCLLQKKIRRKHFILFTLVVVLWSVIYFWPKNIVASTDRQPQAIALQNKAPANSEKPLAIAPKDSRLNYLFNPVNDFDYLTNQADKYLELAGVNAKTLTTAFMMSGNEKYLLQLKPLAGDSLPALATLGLWLEDADRGMFIDKLLKLDPENKLNALLKYLDLMKNGKNDSALDTAGFFSKCE